MNPPSRTWVLGLVLIVAVAAWLRFGGLTRSEFWLDENCTYYCVHYFFDWPEEGPSWAKEQVNLPYTFLLFAWTRLFGETPFGLRTFSAVAGCLTVLVMGLIGRRIGGGTVGLMAAALTAVHPLNVHYSQEARVYALWCLCLTATTYALYRAARAQTTRWWWGYGILALVTTFSHYYTLFWFPATVVAVILAPDRRRFLRQWFNTHAILAVVLSPLVIFCVSALSRTGPQMWLGETWEGYPPILAIPRSIWALLPSGGYPEYVGTLSEGLRAMRWDGWGSEAASLLALWGSVCVMITALAMWLAAAAQRWDSDTEYARPVTGPHQLPAGDGGNLNGQAGFLVLLAITSLVSPFVYSHVVRPAYIVARYDLIAWPAVTLGTAVLIQLAVRTLVAHAGLRHVLLALAIMIPVSGSMITLVGARAILPQNESAERVRRLSAAVGPDDLVVSVGMYRWFLAYELHRQDFAARIISFPPIHDRQLGWQNARDELGHPQRIEMDTEQVLAQITWSMDGGHEAYLLFQGEVEGPRWQVDSRLFSALFQHGFQIDLVDEWLGLGRIARKR
ncbi:MAG: glycosyltransferase family 39 protein [Phycisphaerales bacterium]|nr:MAG: glycosyltransferase family 39 protein [Phycisphaerales bacterium]